MSGSKYWDEFYANRNQLVPAQPSSFASFVDGKINGAFELLELGCGNGRDFSLLHRRAKRAVGLDASRSAVAECELRYPRATFIVGSCSEVAQVIAGHFQSSERLLIYSRFLLHAINDETRETLLSGLISASNKNLIVALEYRINGNLEPNIVFNTHDRFQVDHDAVLKSLIRSGFRIDYEITSRGLAVFREEDPLIGRVIATKSTIE